jgi:hypothetical protein
MTIITTRAQSRELARENARQPATLQEVPREQWPNQTGGQIRVLRSRDFLVQVFPEPPPVHVRLSINRTSLQGQRWQDGITWDELQRLKHEAGYGDCDAVEVFPADRDVVNVANMRHLWVMAEPVSFAWRTRRGAA